MAAALLDITRPRPGTIYRPPEEDARWALLRRASDGFDVPSELPILGWRWWALSVPGDYGRARAHLANPFIHDVYQHRWTTDRDSIHVWRPGVNASRSDWCQEVDAYPREEHMAPQPWCSCGIRSMRSLADLLDYYRARLRRRVLRFDAVALVASWGRICGPNDGSDHDGTLRAEFAEILGPVYLRRPHRAHDIAVGYETGVRSWPAGWPPGADERR